MSARVELQIKAKGERPSYFSDPAVDKILGITMALVGEVAVIRDRLDTIERLLESGATISRATIDAFEANADVRAERDAWRETYLSNVLRIVHQEREDMEKRASDMSYDDAVATVEAN
jgi:hypothetical protein